MIRNLEHAKQVQQRRYDAKLFGLARAVRRFGIRRTIVDSLGMSVRWKDVLTREDRAFDAVFGELTTRADRQSAG